MNDDYIYLANGTEGLFIVRMYAIETFLLNLRKIVLYDF